ncbi:hypothetical protein ZIOFF_024385 [Zingiber officinale]|uniref:Uncharacterized protein n=1 Tax=Zingiber officinale TaxID=94328 RepID=A0A8J5H0A2_ZINOF|nr:hypothetical protein ZIOFF_024385 [Zingiber officinale]
MDNDGTKGACWSALMKRLHLESKEKVVCVEMGMTARASRLKKGNLAGIYYEQSQLDMTILHYKQAINCDSTFIEAYNNLTAADGLVNRGNTFKEIGRVTEAIQDYICAVNIRPTMPKAHANLASAYKDR